MRGVGGGGGGGGEGRVAVRTSLTCKQTQYKTNYFEFSWKKGVGGRWYEKFSSAKFCFNLCTSANTQGASP